MDESQSNQDRSRFGAFANKGHRTAAGMEMHLNGSGPQAPRGYMNGGERPLPSSELAMYDTSILGSNQHFQGLFHGANLNDDQALVPAFENLSFRTPAVDSPTYAAQTQYPSGRRDFTPRVSATHQDDPVPQLISAAYANQKADERAFEDSEQAFSFPSHFGNFSRSPRRPNGDSVFSIPYHPLTAPASPFQQHCHIEEQYPMYTPYGQPIGSNRTLMHDMGAQPYSVMQPHYVYPQVQQNSLLDVAQYRMSNQHPSVFRPANGASSYLGMPNFHGFDTGDHYMNGATVQKSNDRLNSAFVDKFPSTSYIKGSCGSFDFRQFRQMEKAASLYGPGFSQNRITDNSTINPERILMRPDTMNSVRSIKFGPSANGCTDMDQRISCVEKTHLDIQSNDSNLEWLKPQFLASKSFFESAMESHQLTYNSVDEVVGRICTVAKDQNGCRFLQNVFREGTQEDAEKVFAEIIDHIGELMVDPFAHYLVQKILEECSDDQRLRIICEITKVPVDLLKVSCNMHGTRVVQKVIETINTHEQALKVVSALIPGATRLMTDPNGSHVVHRCLQKLLPEYKAFLLAAAASQHLQLARDRHGCCILQKCIEQANDEQKNILLNNITSAALRLAEDQYGNYVIQFLLDLEIEWVTSKIVDELEGHFGNLSMLKCGSHVVERCMKLAPPAVRDRIFNELMNDPKLPHIMLDQFGNYVIQTALEESKGALHTAFVEAIRPHAAALQSNVFGKKVLQRTYLKNKQ